MHMLGSRGVLVYMYVYCVHVTLCMCVYVGAVMWVRV